MRTFSPYSGNQPTPPHPSPYLFTPLRRRGSPPPLLFSPALSPFATIRLSHATRLSDPTVSFFLVRDPQSAFWMGFVLSLPVKEEGDSLYYHMTGIAQEGGRQEARLNRGKGEGGTVRRAKCAGSHIWRTLRSQSLSRSRFYDLLEPKDSHLCQLASKWFHPFSTHFHSFFHHEKRMGTLWHASGSALVRVFYRRSERKERFRISL